VNNLRLTTTCNAVATIIINTFLTDIIILRYIAQLTMGSDMVICLFHHCFISSYSRTSVEKSGATSAPHTHTHTHTPSNNHWSTNTYAHFVCN